ncbi:MAG: AAA family ATPase [Gammaproteobacteria bacterium]|nr:AAA family ATPase [Gammaproteobacteria bacterium]MDE0441138.1 AAA family ATPase [Gammaproteobacteria bacterium]
MITRIEIDGFKTFEDFSLDLHPFTAIVGPNASGKSNLFDAIKFVSRLAQTEIREAMRDLRGRPVELFRLTRPRRRRARMTFAVEVLLAPAGVDAFGTTFELRAQRLRYEVEVGARLNDDNLFEDVSIRRESCAPIAKKDERLPSIGNGSPIKYNGRLRPFISTTEARGEPKAMQIRQDGVNKHGRPVVLSAADAPRTALSTITTAEFPHLYALREMLASVQFLHVDPQASRRPADRLASRKLLPDASNLATVLAKLRAATRTELRPDGVLADIGGDLSYLIPSVARLRVTGSDSAAEYSFDIELADSLAFSSRVISDGTLRLLALLTVLNDPDHGGVLCFEEPENGVHEARISGLVDLLRRSSGYNVADQGGCFQILVNTHSPSVMATLQDEEVVVSDLVSTTAKGRDRTMRTRMRGGVSDDSAVGLTRAEVDGILRRPTETV